MNHRTVALRVCRGEILNGARPQGRRRIFYFHHLVVQDGTGELQIQSIFNAQVAKPMRRIERTPLEANHGLDADRLPIDRDRQVCSGRRVKLVSRIDQIPACDTGRIGRLGID